MRSPINNGHSKFEHNENRSKLLVDKYFGDREWNHPLLRNRNRSHFSSTSRLDDFNIRNHRKDRNYASNLNLSTFKGYHGSDHYLNRSEQNPYSPVIKIVSTSKSGDFAFSAVDESEGMSRCSSRGSISSSRLNEIQSPDSETVLGQPSECHSSLSRCSNSLSRQSIDQLPIEKNILSHTDSFSRHRRNEKQYEKQNILTIPHNPLSRQYSAPESFTGSIKSEFSNLDSGFPASSTVSVFSTEDFDENKVDQTRIEHASE